MAVYERIWRRYAGLQTPLKWRFLVITKYALKEAFASRMLGVHLQDAANEEAEMPLGLGEVDFKLLVGYIPKTAERVLEINQRHGRAEILSSIQFLVDKGF